MQWKFFDRSRGSESLNEGIQSICHDTLCFFTKEIKVHAGNLILAFMHLRNA